MTTISVVILSRNRPDSLKVAIDSIIKQQIKPNKIIVSDNSTTEKKKIITLSKCYKNIEFIFNNKNETVADHYFRVLKEIKSDLISICHDDDRLLPNYINEILNAYNIYKSAIIFSVNGRSFNDTYISKNMLWRSSHKYKKITKVNLFFRWFDIDGSGMAPVSASVFNLNILKKNLSKIRPNYNEGKNYWDTFFFLKANELSYLIWINKDLLRYNIHENSLSNQSDLNYKIAFNLIKKNNSFMQNKLIRKKRDKVLKKYRYIHLLLNIIKKRKFYYKSIVFKLITYLLFNSKYFRKNILSRKLYKYTIKIIKK